LDPFLWEFVSGTGVRKGGKSSERNTGKHPTGGGGLSEVLNTLIVG
jgi:hypothetical protein